MITSSQYHARVWRHLKIKLVKYSLTFVDLAEFHIEILRDVQCLHWLCIVSDIPDVHRKVITREKIIIRSRCKLSRTDRIDDLCKEMLTTWVLFKLDFGSIIAILGWYSHIAKTHIPVAGREEEDIRSFGMILNMCDYFGKLLDIWGLKVDDLVGNVWFLQVPQVNT